MNWTEICIKVNTADCDTAAAICETAALGGIYIEDYSDLEQGAEEIAHIDLIDEELIAKDRLKAIIHIYVSEENSAEEALQYIHERLSASGIKAEITLSGFQNALSSFARHHCALNSCHLTYPPKILLLLLLLNKSSDSRCETRVESRALAKLSLAFCGLDAEFMTAVGVVDFNFSGSRYIKSFRGSLMRLDLSHFFTPYKIMNPIYRNDNESDYLFFTGTSKTERKRPSRIAPFSATPRSLQASWNFSITSRPNSVRVISLPLKRMTALTLSPPARNLRA